MRCQPGSASLFPGHPEFWVLTGGCLTRRFVVIKGAFSKGLASEVVERGWDEMEGKGILRDDPTTWTQEVSTKHSPPATRT